MSDPIDLAYVAHRALTEAAAGFRCDEASECVDYAIDRIDQAIMREQTRLHAEAERSVHHFSIDLPPYDTYWPDAGVTLNMGKPTGSIKLPNPPMEKPDDDDHHDAPVNHQLGEPYTTAVTAENSRGFSYGRYSGATGVGA